MMSAALKSLRKPLTVILTSGAIVLLGLLSFAGMYVLLPLLSVSIAAFILSVIYEGEIYQKNISNALDKLLNEHLAAQILGEELLDKLDLKNRNPLPAFFQTYKNLADKHPSPARDKRLKTMQIWFGKLLMNPPVDPPHYIDAISEFLTDELTNEQIQIRSEEITSRNRNIKVFAMLAAGFMSLGTIFLILEVLPVLPFLSISPALLPFVVIPMASISGIAYGFLSYNSLTDFLLKNNLHSWWQGVKNDLTSENRSWKQIIFAAFSAFVLVLNLTLTLCTAGTWWTVVNATQTTWNWLKHPITQFATALIAPIVSISTLGFNLENTIETINEVKASIDAPAQAVHQHEHLSQPSETIAQRFNPFRIILKVTFTPLLLLLFLGHLISIGLTADRMPGVPAIVSALSGIISEGLEDFHYFFNLDKLSKIFAVFFKILASPFAAISYLFRTLLKPKSYSFAEVVSELGTILSEGFIEAFAPETLEDAHLERHHEHSAIPTQVLEFLFSPLFAISALWHWHFQDSDATQQKSYVDCFYQQIGWNQPSEDNDFENVQRATDDSWKKLESQFELQEQINSLQQQTTAPEVIVQKITVLQNVLEDVNKHSNETTIHLDNIKARCEDVFLNQHRFFQSAEKTASRSCVDQVIRNLTPLQPH